MSKSKRTCVFCGGSPVTAEHVFSKAWLARLVPGATGIATDYAGQQGPDAPIRQGTSQRALGKGGGAEFKTVCKSCNGGWMQNLDEEAKPLLSRLCFVEEGQVAFPDGNHLLARWATKIALVLHSIWPEPFITSAQYANFRKDQEPIAGSKIWIGAMHRIDDIGGRQNMATLKSADEVKVYVATFCILHLVFQVICPRDVNVIVFRTHGFEKFVEQIWPPEAAIDWPPPRDDWLKSEQDFRDLHRALAGVE